MSYKVLGVSAGNGVMLHPFRDNLIGNIEIRPGYLLSKGSEQWDLNFKGIPFMKNDRSFDSSLGPVDVIVGHPKCGNSSMFALSRGKAFTTSQNEPSLTLFMSSVIKYKPKIFALENLPKLLETYSLSDMDRALGENYYLEACSGSVTMFGNSQVSRKRLVVVGVRRDLTSGVPYILHNATQDFLSSQLLTTGALLQDLSENGDITESLNEIITLYSGFKISLKDMQTFWLEHPELRHYPIKNSTMNTAPGVYINREGDYPLTVRKTNRQFNPDGIQMSPREMARIQGIPDSFKLMDSGYNLKTLINKGRFTVANTPPYEVGAYLKKAIDKLL